MRITFNEDYNGVGRNFKKGNSYDVNDAKATIYVRSGLAKPADAEARTAIKEAVAVAPADAKAAKK